MGEVGTEKICPLMTMDTDYNMHCSDKCEWNDGDGCAVWRFVKALQAQARWQEEECKLIEAYLERR